MALKALTDTFRLLVITPYVWICGVFAALSIIGVYLLYLKVGVLWAFGVGAVLALMLPAFIAGSYGIILENHGSPRVYLKSMKNGYFKCLFPMLLVSLICWLGVQAITYILLMFGINAQTAMYLGFFVLIPILFFWYFADLCSMLGARGIFGSLKASAARVKAGSFSVTAFYLFNIAAFFALDFLFSVVFKLFLPENSAAGVLFTSMTEQEVVASVQNMTNNQMANYVTSLMTPEAIVAMVHTAAICVLVALPFFATFKVCFFKRLLTATIPKSFIQQCVERAQEAAKVAQQAQNQQNSQTGEPNNQEPAQNINSEIKDGNSNPPQQPTTPPAPKRAPLPPNDPHAGEDGEYDSKGRWFKYT